MTLLQIIRSVTTNTLWFVIIARASCAHLAPRGAGCNRSMLVGVWKARKQRQKSEITLWVRRLHQLSRWIDDHTSEISGRQNDIVFLTAVIFPTTSKFPTNIDFGGALGPPCPRNHDATVLTWLNSTVTHSVTVKTISSFILKMLLHVPGSRHHKK